MLPSQKVIIFIRDIEQKHILGTMHLAYVLANKLGSVESINVDLQQGEQLILPEDIEKSGFLNISRVSYRFTEINQVGMNIISYSVYERQWWKG